MLIGHEITNDNMRIKTVFIVTTIGLSVCLAASIQEKQGRKEEKLEDGDFEKRDRSAKSLGLHTSIGQYQ